MAFERVIVLVGLVSVLIVGCTQGTVKPDVVESVTAQEGVAEMRKPPRFQTSLNDYSFNATTAPYDSGNDGIGWRGDLGYRWGIGAASDQIFNLIEITHKGEEVWIPYDAFSDLANPREVSWKEVSPGIYRLTIRGGTDGEGYSAEYEFEGEKLLTKVVSSSTFPNEWRQESVYTHLEAGDDD